MRSHRQLRSNVSGSNPWSCQQFFNPELQNKSQGTLRQRYSNQSGHGLPRKDPDEGVDHVLRLPEFLLHKMMIIIAVS